jgi:lipopolysaccharide transport system permease protein
MKHKELILYSVYADLRTEVARRLLGFLWWILEPLMFMGVFYVVFGLGLRQGSENYVAFLLTGMVAWKWFDGSVRQCSSVIAMNAGMLQQVFIPKYALALIQILSNAFKFLIVLFLLLGLLWLMGHPPSWAWLFLPIVLVVQFLLIISVGFFLAAIVPFAQDLKQIVDNMLMLMMFMSGIFFNASSLPDNMQFYFHLNPMVAVIESYRAILLDAHAPDLKLLSNTLLTAVPLMCIGFYILHKYERRYPKMML